MLRVTVELVPYGMENWKVNLLEMSIANEGKNDFDDRLYDYSVNYTLDGVYRQTQVKGLNREVPIDNFLFQVLTHIGS